MTFIAMDFIELHEKVGKGFNCEQLLILCVMHCHGVHVHKRAEACSPRLTAGTE